MSVFFYFNLKVASNKHLKNVMFYIKLKQCIYNARFKFNNGLILIVY